jgi:hypothetical protein
MPDIDNEKYRDRDLGFGYNGYKDFCCMKIDGLSNIDIIKIHPDLFEYITNPTKEEQIQFVISFNQIITKYQNQFITKYIDHKFDKITIHNVKDHIDNVHQEVLDMLMIKDIIE